jgi:DEAD/DEAH box helicase domain-containing protein
LENRTEEIEKRRQRARTESFSISVAAGMNQEARKFLVRGTSGRDYKVVIDFQSSLKSCECHDFLNAALGTCKHIEAVLIREGGQDGSAPKQALSAPSPEAKDRPDAPTTDFHLTPSQPQLDAPEKPPGSPRHLVCFDVETQNSFDDVGGRQNFGALRVSIAVVYDELLNQYFVYNESEASQLIDHLFAADLVVGYNIAGFDYAVLQPYSSKNLKKLPTLDLMQELAQRLGFRVKLDSVVNATLGARKSGHGLQAIEWFRKGEIEKLTRYCQDDVKLTYDLFKFGTTHGFVYIDSRGARQRVLVNWK